MKIPKFFKSLISVITVGAIFCSFCGCSSTGGSGMKKEPIKHSGKELLVSPDFSSGFNVRSTTTADGALIKGRFDYGKKNASPVWTVSQWGASESITDGKVTKLSNGYWCYEGKDLTLTVDTKAGMVKQAAYASKCYEETRTGVTQWLHLLVEQYLGELNGYKAANMQDYRLSNLDTLYATGRFKLTYFEDHMGDTANPGQHCASYLFYLNLQNLNKESKDFGKIMHFGLNIFDNREEYTKLYCAKDLTTPNYIYTLGSESFFTDSFFKDGKPYGSEDNDFIVLDLDVYPYLKIAFEDAISKGFLKNTEFEDLYISAYSIGWEVPGTYDVEMCAKDISLKATYK